MTKNKKTANGIGVPKAACGLFSTTLKSTPKFLHLVKELYFSETGKLSAAEIGELLYDDDLKDWDAIRVLGGSTETKNLEPAECPYMIETEKQGLRILKRCEAITLRVW